MTIDELKNELKNKIQEIDKRIERLSAPSFYDQSTKIENLQGEALAYEKILKMCELRKVMEMDKVERELRDLMDLYDKRYEKLESERQEAKKDEDVDAEMNIECLQRQCRIMRAELFKTMKNLGVLDDEEVLYGGIKSK